MDARQYNAWACDRIWKRSDLPSWLKDLSPSGPEFEGAVRRYQGTHGLTPDGWLGKLTWASIQGEKLDFGPTNLSNTIIVPTQRQEAKRALADVVGVGIHTTGSGLAVQARKMQQAGRKEDEWPLVKEILRNLLANPQSYSSAGYVFPDGETWLTIPVDEQAVHGGYAGTEGLYRQGYEVWKGYRGTCFADLKKVPGERYVGWKVIADQEGFSSPLDLCDNPNRKLWAFDLLPTLTGKGESFTDAQFARAAELVAWASEFFGFKIGFRTVLEHRLWNPMCRWPWDPGANFTRRRLCDALLRVMGCKVRLGGDDA